MGDVFAIHPSRLKARRPGPGDQGQVRKLHKNIGFEEFDTEYVLTIELRTLGLSKIEATLVGYTLYIQADWKPAARVTGSVSRRSRSCISRSSLRRAFVLPGDVLRRQIDAAYGNGVLKIRLPREAGDRLPRKINIAGAI